MINKKNLRPMLFIMGGLLLLSLMTSAQARQMPQSNSPDAILYDQARETEGHQMFEAPPHLLDSYLDLGNLLHNNLYSMLLDNTDFIKLQDMVRHLWQKQMQPDRIAN